MDLGLLLDMAVAGGDDRRAVCVVGGASLTTGELAQLAEAAAARFLADGCTHVAYCGVNGPALPVSLFGAARAGLPFVPLNYRLSNEQLADVALRHDLVVVAGGDDAARLHSLGIQRTIDPAELLAPPDQAAGPLPEPDADAVALLIYTSGTTSSPKAAVLRHRHLTSYVVGTVEFASMAPTDAVLVSVPPYHVAGVMNLLSNLYAGRRIVYLDPFDPRAWLDAVGDEGITHAMVVPTMLARIVKALDGQRPDLPTLRSISYGGAPMPLPVIEQALDLFPDVAFTNAYGLTETSSTITLLGPDDHRAAHRATDPALRDRLRSAGRPLPGVELEVRDEEGRPCPPGAVGAIFVRGEQVAGEYVGAKKGDDGWFDTRDRGHLDADGYLFIEGRSDDTIIRGGENIAPAEVEDVLLRHAAVADCAVVGLADEEWGQRVAAAVVFEPGSAVTPEELAAFARDHLRSSKTPDVIVVEDSLPYTETGKLLRRLVRERIAATTRPVPAGAAREHRPAPGR